MSHVAPDLEAANCGRPRGRPNAQAPDTTGEQRAAMTYGPRTRSYLLLPNNPYN